ncbi:MAG: metallophosphoesterase family protein, partial [Gaiellales bacterium]
MRIYYAGDVHGSEKCWRKFLNAAKFYEVDTLVMGGDITGKVMVPIVETADGRHQARVLGRDEVVASSELDELEKRIRFNGFYPYRCDRN